MNTRFYALLSISIASLALAGPAWAMGPRFMDGDFVMLAARNDLDERNLRKQEQREARKENRHQDKRDRGADDNQQERGYGYGYERRYPQQKNDSGGRR